MQIHDQGAGGNCNVVKEIIYPLGAEINIRKVKLGDATMSTLEIWGAEYQENDCVLIRPESEALLQDICNRERTYMQVQLTSRCRCCVHANVCVCWRAAAMSMFLGMQADR